MSPFKGGRAKANTITSLLPFAQYTISTCNIFPLEVFKNVARGKEGVYTLVNNKTQNS